MSKRSVSMSAAGASVVSKDPNFKNVALLLQGDISNPDLTYNAFSDASSNNFAITPNGDAYGSPFSPYNTSWSNYFDGSGDYLDLPSNAAFDPGTSGEWSIECFVYCTGDGAVLGTFGGGLNPTNGWDILFGSEKFYFRYWYPQGTYFDSGGTAASKNTWNHVAVCRNSTRMSMFLNGNRVWTTTTNLAISSPSNTFKIGKNNNTADTAMAGYISNVRLLKGSTAYDPTATTIAISTTSLTGLTNTQLLTCQSNRFIDNSSNNFALTRNGDVAVRAFSPFTDTDTTTGSGYFDGSGDYLNVASNSAFSYGTGSFTYEFWVYAKDWTSNFGLINTNTTYGFGMGVGSSTFRIYSASLASFWTPSTSTSWNNAWTHVAFVRNGSTNTLYINGVSIGSVTNSNNYPQQDINIDYADAGLPVYIADCRIVKGVAVYTSNFTPPTAPLTAIANTSLLTLQTRGATQNIGIIDSSPNRFPITRVGNTTQGTFSPYGNLWSIYSPFSANRIAFNSNSAFGYGTGDWSIEFWVFIPSNFATSGSGSGGVGGLVSNRVYADGQTTPCFYTYSPTNQLVFEPNGSSSLLANGLSSYYNSWIHVVGTRQSGVSRLFVNGILQGSGANTADAGSANKLDLFCIANGYQYNQGSSLSNIRVCKGSVPTLYQTSSTTVGASIFTPPTTPLTTSSQGAANVSFLFAGANRFKDQSANPVAVSQIDGSPSVQRFSPFNPTAPYSASTIGGSGYFDGSGDYLQTTFSAQNLINQDFTVEFWVYQNVWGGTFWGSNRTAAGDGGTIHISTDTNGRLYGDDITNSSSGMYGGSNAAFPTKTWNYISLTRTGSTFLFHVNGILYLSDGTKSSWYNNTSSNMTVGAIFNGNNSNNGYIASLKVTKSAVYSSANYTPPSSFTSSGSGFYDLKFTNAGIPDLSMQNDLETVGNAQVSTSVKKYGTGSLAFDGTGDWLSCVASPQWIMSGDWTLEAWIYPTSVSGVRVIIDTRGGTSSTSPVMYTNGTNLVIDTGAAAVISAGTISTNTWQHVAATRSGNSWRLFINGTQVGSTTTNTTSYTTAYGAYVGNSWASEFFTGYIDDLRITKGYARYTTNFTPPTQSFPNQ